MQNNLRINELRIRVPHMPAAEAERLGRRFAKDLATWRGHPDHHSPLPLAGGVGGGHCDPKSLHEAAQSIATRIARRTK